MSYKLLFLIFAAAFFVGTADARMPLFLHQDFEDANVFEPAAPFSTGVGDGNDTVGLYQGLSAGLMVVSGDYYPKTDQSNSSFTVGYQSARVKRTFAFYEGEPMSVGCLGAKRTNHQLTGKFHAEFSLYIADANGQFVISLKDSQNANSNQIAAAFMGKKLYIANNGVWTSKSSGVLQGKWFKIAFVGDLATGYYSSYINFGNNGWLLLSANDHFDNTVFTNITGFIMIPWLDEFEFCIDDIVIYGEYDEPASCGEALDMGHDFAGDINKDCKVTLADIELFLSDWLYCVDPQNAECTVPF
ncbi:MAG: hypothetical protein ABFD79_15305 [Phycisphaerales bacterium]